MTVFVTRCSRDLRYLWVNRAYAQWLGLTPAHIEGKLIVDVIGREAFDALYPKFTTVLAGQEVHYEELLNFQGAGFRWVTADYSPTFDASGVPDGWVAVVNDITDRKRMESALHESEERFRLMADNAPVLIWMSGPDKLCSWFNKPWLRFVGRSMEQELGYGWADNIHPDDVASCVCSYEQAFDARQPFTMEYRLRRHDGAYRWILDIGIPLYGPDGIFTGYIGSCMDITEHKNLEDQLRQRAEEIEKLMDVLPLAVFIAHDPECRRITGNRAGYELLRLPPGSNLSVTPPPGEKPPFFARRNGQVLAAEELPMQIAAAQGVELRGVEVEHVYPDGTSHTLYGSASPLRDAQGNVRGCVGSFLDITERKMAEEALNEANQRKDEFLAMLAHELRNPLAPIRNAVQILRLLGPAEANLQRAREMIDRQVQHLTRLVDDLLDVSRITRGKVTLHKERVDLTALVGRVVETSRPWMDARHHELTASLPSQPIWIEGDATRLTQVFANLMNNAAKYTRDGGRIWLTLERVDSEAVLRIKDTGIGMAPELLPRVFEMFIQGDRGLARSEGGLGIGLTMVKRLVEMHGGRVEAHSSGPDHGSEFTVRLPLPPSRRETPAAQPSAPSASLEAVPQRRILVVDDNIDAADSVGILLRMAGHQVHIVHDGASALQEAQGWDPEIIFLDIGLPKMDGYEVARRLRKQMGMTKTLLVAVTGYGQDEDRRQAKDAGFNMHLVKPADPEVLLELLAQVDVKTGSR